MGCLCPSKKTTVDPNNDQDNLDTKKEEEEPVNVKAGENADEPKQDEDPNRETTIPQEEPKEKQLDTSKNLDLSRASGKGKKKRGNIFTKN